MRKTVQIEALHRQLLADRFAPASVVVNGRGEVLDESGPMEPFLAAADRDGAPLVSRVHADLRAQVRAALGLAMEQRDEVFMRGLEARHRGRLRRLDLLITPLSVAGEENLWMVVFKELEPRRPGLEGEEAAGGPGERGLVVERLEVALEETQERLRQSLDELRLSNEESRLTNDELRFSQEELQIANQRLLTANIELQSKVEKLDRAHADLNNLIRSTDIPTLFLDPDLRIRWFTPAAGEVFRVADEDVGRPLTDLRSRLRGAGLTEAIGRVLSDWTPREVSVRRSGDEISGERRYLARVHPYRTLSDDVDGAVLTFFDVTDRELAVEGLEANSRRQAALSELGLFALHSGLPGLLGEAVRVLSRNLSAEFCEVLRAEGDSLMLQAAEGWTRGATSVAVEDIRGESPAARALTGDSPVVFQRRRGEGGRDLPARLEEAGVQSGVVCVLHGWNENYGVLGAYSIRPDHFGWEEVEFVGAVANILAAAASRDAAVRKLHESEARHRRQAQELATLYETAPIGLTVVDREHRMINVNDRIARLHGVPREELEGKVVWDVFPALSPAVRPNLEQVIRDHEPRFDVEFAAPLYEGEEPRHWQCSYVPIEDAQGSVEAVSCVIQEVTERVESEEALRDADRHKDEFLALLGHELRNPLSAIVNANELQKMLPAGDPRLSQMTQAIGRQAFQMKRLIDDLLDVSRIARGKIRIQDERVDLRWLVQATVEDYEGLVPNEMDLDLDLPPHSVWVVADPARLSQVLENLLNNAIKFSEVPGTITVALETAAGQARLCVRDAGIGIEPAVLDDLFEPFQQARSSSGGAPDGLGLGLALVKGIIELHGGRVSAWSEGPGCGSEFVAEIPQSAQEVSEEAPEEERPEPPAGLRILLVEDNADAAELMAELLTSAGHDVSVAHDADEGLARARDCAPEIILCDLGLPGKSGLDFAKEVRAGAAPRPGFLVALTGYGSERDVSAALEAGFDQHLTKPIDWEVLDQILRGGVARV